MQNVAKNLMTTSAAARLLLVSEQTVRNLERRGILPASRLSNGCRVFERRTVENVKASREGKHRQQAFEATA